MTISRGKALTTQNGEYDIMPKGAAHFISFVLIVGALVLGQQFRESGKRRHYSGVEVAGAALPPAVREDGISVYFSPRGGCEAAVVQQINKAEHTIDVQAYGFTSSAIAQALSQAKDRGVTIRVVLDREATKENDVQTVYLLQHGISEWTDGEHPIAHNKVMVIDGQTVITGSFNFTRQAENANAENMMILTDHLAIAAAYEKNLGARSADSQAFASDTTLLS